LPEPALAETQAEVCGLDAANWSARVFSGISMDLFIITCRIGEGPFTGSGQMIEVTGKFTLPERIKP